MSTQAASEDEGRRRDADVARIHEATSPNARKENRHFGKQWGIVRIWRGKRDGGCESLVDLRSLSTNKSHERSVSLEEYQSKEKKSDSKSPIFNDDYPR
ncbi:hypothetical protein Ancab_020720 [Ancistrocladus abbreviatus]